MNAPALSTREILLVEDNVGDVDLTKAAFRRAEVPTNITVARDGVEALAMLNREGEFADVPRPEIILLDLNMPRLNGRELLALIKDDPELKRIPVVVLTTSKAEADIVQSYDLHANAYLTKPVDFGQFNRIVKVIEEFWFNVAILPCAASY
jgi:CheY-like chemotaxis protein